MGIVGGGAHAEYSVAHEREVLPMPSDMSFEDAAAISTTAGMLTIYAWSP